jgi:hypothetical protein
MDIIKYENTLANYRIVRMTKNNVFFINQNNKN